MLKNAVAEVSTLPALVESDGMMQLLYYPVPLLQALDQGGVVAIDELDTSLHPLLVRHVVEVFHSPNNNSAKAGNAAQLVFTTHTTHPFCAVGKQNETIQHHHQKLQGPGRPPIYGRKLTLDDFELTPVAETDYKVGCRMVRTNLFGDREVLAFTTQKGEHGSKRLFLCTKPDACKGFLEHIQALPKR